MLGNQITFTDTVTNGTDTSVSWSVNRIAGGSSSVGTISPTGGYTAPADLSSPATVQITATSHADSPKSATANITVTSDITLSLTPNPASVECFFDAVKRQTVGALPAVSCPMDSAMEGGVLP